MVILLNGGYKMKKYEHGKVWFNNQFRLFSNYDPVTYVRIRIGNEWKYVNIKDVAKWPKLKENKES